MNLSPDEIDLLRRALPLLQRIAGENVEPQLMPASWFTKNTKISSDQLAKEVDHVVGRVRREGRHHLYDFAKVRDRWPAKWIHPRTKQPPKLS